MPVWVHTDKIEEVLLASGYNIEFSDSAKFKNIKLDNAQNCLNAFKDVTGKTTLEKVNYLKSIVLKKSRHFVPLENKVFNLIHAENKNQ